MSDLSDFVLTDQDKDSVEQELLQDTYFPDLKHLIGVIMAEPEEEKDREILDPEYIEDEDVDEEDLDDEDFDDDEDFSDDENEILPADQE